MLSTRHNRTFKFVAAAATAVIAAAMTVAVTLPTASAAPLAISTSGDAYTPKTGTVTVGDTVNFSGIGSHNTISTIIPAGAATFDSGSASTLAYKVTAPGVYNYMCTDHGGMSGTFTATAAAGSTPVATATATTPVATTPADTTTTAPAAGAPAPAAPAPAAAAVTHKVVTGPGNVFTPAALAVKVGDSVSITGLADHPTKSDVFPAGAAPIALAFTDITYKVAVPGKYTYLCIAHKGMTGSFTATGAAATGGAAAAPAAPAAPAPAAPAPAAPAPAAVDAAAQVPGVQGQVSQIPSGGIQTGGGSTAGFNNSGLVTLGVGLLMASFMSVMLRRRVAVRQD